MKNVYFFVFAYSWSSLSASSRCVACSRWRFFDGLETGDGALS
jgi:hypothetical protein